MVLTIDPVAIALACEMLRSVKLVCLTNVTPYGAEVAIDRHDYKHSAPTKLTYLHRAPVWGIFMKNTRKGLGKMSLVRTALWLALPIILVAISRGNAFAQTPTPTPDNRGLGVQSAGPTNSSQGGQQAREAKPELVLQTGYNNFMGATRLVFSPDGRLLATATFRSSTIKLWETATGRELRDLSSGTQSAMGMSPYIAFSRDSRLIAAAAGDNSVRIWDVTSGRELQTLAGSQGSLASAMGVSFIGFAADGQIVTVSDAIKVWDAVTGRELRTVGTTSLNVSGLIGGEGGASISPDGKQLASVATDATPLVRVWDIATGREVRTVDLPDDDMSALEISFTPDGGLLASGVADKQVKLWDLTAKRSERKLGQTAKEHVPVTFSRDGRQLMLVEGYTVRRWDLTTAQELPALRVPNSGLLSGEAGAFVSFSEDGKKNCERRFRYANHPLGSRNRETTRQDERPHQHGLQSEVQRRWHSTIFGRADAVGSAHRSWFAYRTWSIRQDDRLAESGRPIDRHIRAEQQHRGDFGNPHRKAIANTDANYRRRSCPARQLQS